MSTPEFSLDWPHGWMTRDGRSDVVRMIGTTHDGDLVLEMAYEPEFSGRLHVRRPDGRVHAGICHYDIINKPAPKREYWVNVYRDYVSGLHTSRSAADANVSKTNNRIACVKITEGDGL